MLAGVVMDAAAVLLNDRAKSRYTYLVQTPLLKLALQELADELADNGVPRLQKRTAPTTITAGVLLFPLPSDFDVPIALYEKTAGETDNNYCPINFTLQIPLETPSFNLDWYSYTGGLVNFRAATRDRLVIMDYYLIVSAITDETTALPFDNALNFLAHRTAELAAKSVGGAAMQIRANWLSQEAAEYLDRYVAVRVKQTQSASVTAAGYDEES